MTIVRILSAEHGDVATEVKELDEAERIIRSFQARGREGFTPEGGRIATGKALLEAEEVIVPFRLMGG